MTKNVPGASQMAKREIGALTGDSVSLYGAVRHHMTSHPIEMLAIVENYKSLPNLNFQQQLGRVERVTTLGEAVISL